MKEMTRRMTDKEKVERLKMALEAILCTGCTYTKTEIAEKALEGLKE